MKLNQLLAIEKGVKNKAHDELTALHRKSSVAALYEGRERTYDPKDEDGEKFPSESQKVQLRSKDVISQLQKTLSELYDITFMKDHANMEAKASIVVDGNAILDSVPVSYLLWLEKQLDNLHKFVSEIPILDSSEDWEYNEGQAAFRGREVQTTKSKKIMKPVVLYEATDKHPAQVKEASEDVVIGHWTQVRYSGAMSETKKESFLSRIEKLMKATKIAREEANAMEVRENRSASKIFGYLFS